VTEAHERRGRLEHELHEAVKGWRLYPVVQAIQALRGVDLTGAIIVIAELGDLTRFETPAAHELPGDHPVGVLLGGAAAAGRHHQGRQHPRPARAVFA
jgi:hypothetical protein